jgi:hypothetical protein
MTKTIFSFLVILYLTSCSSGQASTEKSQSDTTANVAVVETRSTTTSDTVQKVASVPNSTDSVKSRLKGAWTDGTTDGATFDIKDKTIFYVDEGGEYKYSVNGDMISIRYPDYIYKAKLSFQSDTLIMNSEEYGETKFWRFKN